MERHLNHDGAYAAAMGGLGAIAFTGGTGENSAAMRRRICERLKLLGSISTTRRRIRQHSGTREKTVT